MSSDNQGMHRPAMSAFAVATELRTFTANEIVVEEWVTVLHATFKLLTCFLSVTERPAVHVIRQHAECIRLLRRVKGESAIKDRELRHDGRRIGA